MKGTGMNNSFLEGNSAKKINREKSAFRSSTNLITDGVTRRGMEGRNAYDNYWRPATETSVGRYAAPSKPLKSSGSGTLGSFKAGANGNPSNISVGIRDSINAAPRNMKTVDSSSKITESKFSA